MTNKLIRDIKEVIRRLRNRGISFDANRQYPAIPTIDDTTQSHTNALRAIREALETHERRNPKATLDSFVRLYELEDVLGGFKPGESSVPWATQEEVDAGEPRYKAVDPETGAYAYDRFRWPGQHAAGKGTAPVVVEPVAGVATIDCNLSNVFDITLSAASTELANPVNPLNGQTINIHLRQNATGNRDMTFGTAWTFVNGVDPVLTADPLAVDLLSCQWDATAAKMRCAFLTDFGSGNTEVAPPLATDLVFANVGGGQEIFRDRVGLNVAFRTLTVEGDLSISTVGDNVVLSYTAPLTLPTSFASLTDVDLTGVADGNLLQYQAGQIVPYTIPTVTDTTVQTFLTEADETATLPNSRRLVAGPYMDFDASTPGELAITLSAAPSSTLDALTDVNTAGVVDGNALVYDAGTSTWVPGTVSSGGGGGSEFDGDPYFGYVVALLYFNGTDGNTAFTDQTGRVWTANGNAQLDTAQAKFGTASLLLDGTGDFASTANDSQLSVATGDFTIEAWVQRTSAGTTDTISNKRSSSGAQEHSLSFNTFNQAVFTLFNGSAIAVCTSTTTILADGIFHHIAATRQGTTVRLFIDGVLESTATQSGSVATNSSPLLIGRDGFDSSRDFGGWIDSYRFTKGVCRYTETFGLPTAEFPNSIGAVPEAPKDNALYGRQNGSWEAVRVGGALPAMVAIQEATQSVVSSTVYVPTDLSLSLEAGKTYLVKLGVHCSGLATNFLNLQLVYSGTMSLVSGNFTVNNVLSSNSSQFTGRFTSLPALAQVGTTTDFVVNYDVLVTTTSSGTLLLNMAQNTSSGTTVNVYAGSWMSAELVTLDSSIGASGAEVTRNTDFSVGLTTFTDIPFITEARDDEDYWNVSNPERFTIPRAGWYICTAYVQWNSTSAYRALYFYKNGDAVASEVAGSVASSGSLRHSISYLAYHVAGDYIKLKGYAATSSGTISGSAAPMRMAISRLDGPRGPTGPEGPIGENSYSQVAYQYADLPVVSNAVFQDTDLKLTLRPGTYAIEAETFLSSHATPGAILQLNFSGAYSSSIGRRASYESGAAGWGGAIVTSLPSTTNNLNSTQLWTHQWRQHIVVTADGLLSIQVRQNTSNGTSITFKAGSYLRVIPVTESVNIDTEVLADSPRGYWKLDEASGSLADSSGNGYTLPVVGTPITQYQWENFDPKNPNRKGMLVNNSSQVNYAGGITLGLTPPITTYTFECWGVWHQAGYIASIGADGETSATNAAMQIEITAAGTIEIFWEYGSGTNAPTPPTYLGGALNSQFVHIAVVKDAAARTIKAYINGRLASNGTYTAGQEHTGGTSGLFSLFNSLPSSLAGADGVYCGAAFYTTALSQDRIKAHARALGLIK